MGENFNEKQPSTKVKATTTIETYASYKQFPNIDKRFCADNIFSELTAEHF